MRSAHSFCSQTLPTHRLSRTILRHTLSRCSLPLRPGFITGSMREYYELISRDRITVSGEVHGWFRLPQPLSFYTAGASGMGSFPQNAQGMARDAGPCSE